MTPTRAARRARAPRRSAAAPRSVRAARLVARPRRRRVLATSRSQRRGSPAGSPPSASATSPASARARFRVSPRRGFGCRAARASPASICASVFGPMPGHRVAAALPPRPLATRPACARRAPAPSSRIRFGADAEQPRRAPTSSGSSLVLELAVARASSPVSTSSRSRASIPGPIPRSSRTRPCPTSSATGAGVSRISSAARR